jgi:glutathione S-transferase
LRAPAAGERLHDRHRKLRPFQRLIAALLGRPTDETVITAALPNAKICFAELARLKGQHTFMTGEKISIADLMLAPQLEALSRTPEGKTLLAGSPLLARLERMLARKSMQATTRERLAAGALQPA